MARAVDVIFTIRDAKNKQSKTTLHVPTGFSLAQYGEFALGMGQVIADLLDGEIMDVAVSIPLSLSGATLRTVANNLADVAEKALFTARSVVNGLFARFNIPTFDDSFITPGSDEIGLADSSIAAYVAVIETGTGAAPTDMRGNSIDEITSGREIFRKRS